MLTYRISKCTYIDDLRGTGAALYGGRWHNKGTYILYTAASPSLAMLESIVHISTLAIPDFCIICLEIPDDSILVKTESDLPSEWNAIPAPDILKNLGDTFINQNKFLALQLPSVVMPKENNFLLNPAHPAFGMVKKIYQSPIPFDERLTKK